MRALSARRQAAPDENVRAWLFTILRNVWRNELRRRRHDREECDVELDAMVSSGADPLELLDGHQTGTRLQQAVEALPEAFREVLVLRCVEGLSYQEIARVAGCPAGTVMSRLARARALLRKALAPALVVSRGKEPA